MLPLEVGLGVRKGAAPPPGLPTASPPVRDGLDALPHFPGDDGLEAPGPLLEREVRGPDQAGAFRLESGGPRSEMTGDSRVRENLAVSRLQAQAPGIVGIRGQPELFPTTW